MPLVSAAREAEAQRALEPRSSKPARATERDLVSEINNLPSGPSPKTQMPLEVAPLGFSPQSAESLRRWKERGLWSQVGMGPQVLSVTP
jgi:hypothetical protein